MVDQAQSLRNTFLLNSKMGKIISISSGKGGVGKSNITLNLAISLSLKEKKVAIIDADIGLSNIEILLGQNSQYNFLDVINKNKSFEKATIVGPNGIRVLSGGSGIATISKLDKDKINALIDIIIELKKSYDYILIDTGAGISENVTKFTQIADESIIVTTAEPPAITDAYALIKILILERLSDNISIIVNKVANKNKAEVVYNSIKAVSNKFLEVDPKFCGYVLEDKQLQEAVYMQKPIMLLNEYSKASKCIQDISSAIIGEKYINQKEETIISKIKNMFK